jgi:hypothetical protein
MDTLQNRHRQYDAQYEAIGAMYDPEDGTETDWKSLAPKLEEALSDPALPRYYRAEYHIINAWCSPEPESQLDFARGVLDDMVPVLQADGSSQEQIDARLVALQEMFDFTEGAVKGSREKKAIRNKQKYAIIFHEAMRVVSVCMLTFSRVAKAEGTA